MQHVALGTVSWLKSCFYRQKVFRSFFTIFLLNLMSCKPLFILQETHSQIQAGTWISFPSGAGYHKKSPILNTPLQQQLHHIQVCIETQWLQGRNLFNHYLGATWWIQPESLSKTWFQESKKKLLKNYHTLLNIKKWGKKRVERPNILVSSWLRQYNPFFNVKALLS